MYIHFSKNLKKVLDSTATRCYNTSINKNNGTCPACNLDVTAYSIINPMPRHSARKLSIKSKKYSRWLTVTKISILTNRLLFA